MKYPGTDLGFPSFASYKPGVDYPGVTIDNAWLMQYAAYPLTAGKPGIATAEDIHLRTGILDRSFADASESVVSIAVHCCRNYLAQKNLTVGKCKGILLGTSGIDAKGLGLSSQDCTNINENDTAALVQKTAEKIAEFLEIDGLRIGKNWACSTAAITTKIGIDNAGLLKEGEFFLMPQVEAMIEHVDLSDQNTGILFGDYTAVTAIQRGATRFRILNAIAEPIEKGAEKMIYMAPVENALDAKKHRRDRMCIRMPDGKAVMSIGSKQMIEAIEESLASYNAGVYADGQILSPENIGLVSGHHPNKRFEKTLASAWRQKWRDLESPLIDVSLEHAGNNFSASWGRRMSELQQGRGPVITEDLLIASPFAGAGENFMEDKMTYGCLLLQAGRK